MEKKNIPHLTKVDKTCCTILKKSKLNATYLCYTAALLSRADIDIYTCSHPTEHKYHFHIPADTYPWRYPQWMLQQRMTSQTGHARNWRRCCLKRPVWRRRLCPSDRGCPLPHPGRWRGDPLSGNHRMWSFPLEQEKASRLGTFYKKNLSVLERRL